MSKSLFVSNLAPKTDSDDLRALFSEAGEVQDATVMRNSMTGDSKGFGFVVMAHDSEAAEALRLFNGRDLNGRKLRVEPNKNER